MTASEIRAGVQALKPWFHQLDLGQGIFTKSSPAGTEPVDHPHGTWQIIQRALPRDLTAKSVLDVGCNAGFYAFEAKRRNAAHVLGVDSQKLHVRQGVFAREVLGLDVAFQRMSVYDLNPADLGQFDVTLALGLIYHCKHLFLALERLFHMTKDLLILESAALPSEKRFEPFADPTARPGRLLHTLAYVANDPQAKEAVFNWFVPSVDCLEAMLRDVGFDTEVFSVAHGRVVLLCRRPATAPDSYSSPHLLAAALSCEEGPVECHVSEPIQFRIRAENRGRAVWLARGQAGGEKGSVRLGVHLLDANGREIVWDYARIGLTGDLEPGLGATLAISAQSPPSPGKYHVEFDMVSEHLTWFEDNGSVPLVRELVVV